MAKKNKRLPISSIFMSPKNFAILFIFLFLLFGVGGLIYNNRAKPYTVKTATQNDVSFNEPKSSPTISPTDLPTPTPPGIVVFDENRGWKIFTSQEYGFQVKFPARGLSIDYNCKGSFEQCSKEIDCGNGITLGKFNEDIHIQIDNFFQIYITNYSSVLSLKDYMISEVSKLNMDYNNLFTLDKIENANADEAYAINHKPGMLRNGDNVPFAFSIAIYKKGNRLYQMAVGQQIGSGSCYAPVKGVYWHEPRNFKFL